MAEKIGPQHGFEAARIRENEFHPGLAAWDKRAEALKKLAANNDEFVDRLAAVEAAVLRPFE